MQIRLVHKLQELLLKCIKYQILVNWKKDYPLKTNNPGSHSVISLIFRTLKSRYHAHSLYYLDNDYDVINKINKADVIFIEHKYNAVC